jgi:hypothetical protein
VARGRTTQTRRGRGSARRTAVRGGAVLWVVFTLVAVGAGLAAANSVGAAISGAGSKPRTDAQIHAALGAAARTGANPSPRATPGTGRPRSTPTPRAHPASTSGSSGTPHNGGTGQTQPSGGQPSSPATPQPSATASGSGDQGQPGGGGGGTSGEQRATVSSSAGTVVASCSNGTVTLLTWSPALGYRVNEVHRGPSREAQITFSNDSHGDVTMVITCGSDGRPHATVEPDTGSGD